MLRMRPKQAGLSARNGRIVKHVPGGAVPLAILLPVEF